MSKRKLAEEAQAPETQAAEAANPAAPVEERQPGDEQPEPAKKPFQVVRGWSSRLTGPVQYQKFTDANLKIIGFKFKVKDNEAPPEEVLAVMREHKVDKDGNSTGLKFETTRTHGKIWTIPNDIEGRALADKIDYRLSQLAEKMQATPGQTPF